MRLRPLLLLSLSMLLFWPLRAAFADEAASVQRLVNSGDLVTALQRVERATAADPRNAKLRFLHGVILLEQQRDDAAMALFEGLTQDFPELPEPYNNIALLHARAGRLEPARVALETALRNDPGLLAARQNLGDIYLRLALQAWSAVAAVTPADAALQRKLKLARELATPAR